MTPPRLALAAAVTLALVAGCNTSRSDPMTSPDATSPPAIRIVDAALLPATVDALPSTDVAGFEELLRQLRGIPVVVNFWAAWCEPCESETPRLVRAARDHADTIQFLGVDILDDRGDATAFIDRFGVPYPSLFDPTGAIRTSVGSLGQPVTVFYDAAGSQVAKVDGEIAEDVLQEHLVALAGSS